MRILVTGAAGFVGGHLGRELAGRGHTLIALDPQAPTTEPAVWSRAVMADVRDGPALAALLGETRPEACVHLAGCTFAGSGWALARDMIAVNTLGTLALLEACRQSAPDARLLVVSSAQVYGTAERGRPVREDDPLAPENLYAVSKAAADQAARLYARHQGLHVVVARPFNHIGPGQQPPFAVPSFVRQLRDVAAGRAAEVRVGNLDARRDFTDVRDVVRAYRLLLERGRPGEAYNIASGRRIAVRDVFDRLCRKLGVEPRIVSDPGLFRPADDSPLLDTRKLRHDTAWAPERDLDATLTDILAS